MRMMLFILAAMLTVPGANALATDHWVSAVAAYDLTVALEPGGVAACAAAQGSGDGFGEQDWTDRYSFHLVLTTGCGTFPLDFETRWTRDGFVVTGPLGSSSASGTCERDELDWSVFDCDVQQGALHVRGVFAHGVIII